ncbi:divalent-cation tolerance protein CutA [bacterium]|nr:MAG: divalent-cation tolerance protein CutA [bacterium]
MKAIVVLVTCASLKEAKYIAEGLIKNKLAACVNILEKVESIFRWQAKVETAGEVLLMIKSKKSILPKLIKLVKSRHSYKVPEIIAIPIIAGEKNYLRWLDESLR